MVQELKYVRQRHAKQGGKYSSTASKQTNQINSIKNYVNSGFQKQGAGKVGELENVPRETRTGIGIEEYLETLM